MIGRPRRLALLAEGRFTPAEAKTAVGVLRCRPDEVAAARETGLSATDRVRFGAEPLADVLAGLRRDHAPAA